MKNQNPPWLSDLLDKTDKPYRPSVLVEEVQGLLAEGRGGSG